MNKWLQSIAEIKEHVHDGSEEAKPDLVDITGEVVELADSIWGRHDLSPDMGLVALARPTLYDREFGLVLAVDKTLKNEWLPDRPMQGGYIHPGTGLFITQHAREALVFDWLDERQLPPRSPFAIERELLIKIFAVDALSVGTRRIRAERERVRG